MTLTRETVVAALQAYEENGDDKFGYDLTQLQWDRTLTVELTLPDERIVQAAYVSQEGGHEGDGRDVSIIFMLQEYPEQFWALDGYYSSWDGTTWQGVESIYPVWPEIVTLVQYSRTPPKVA